MYGQSLSPTQRQACCVSDPVSKPFRHTYGTAVWLATLIKSRWDIGNKKEKDLNIIPFLWLLVRHATREGELSDLGGDVVKLFVGGFLEGGGVGWSLAVKGVNHHFARLDKLEG